MEALGGEILGQRLRFVLEGNGELIRGEIDLLALLPDGGLDAVMCIAIECKNGNFASIRPNQMQMLSTGIYDGNVRIVTPNYPFSGLTLNEIAAGRGALGITPYLFTGPEGGARALRQVESHHLAPPGTRAHNENSRGVLQRLIRGPIP